MELHSEAVDKHSLPGGSKRSQLAAIGGNYFNRDAIIILLVAWSARLIFMLAIPGYAHSFDVFLWESVAKVMDAGQNPYQATVFLCWPPFWMQVLFVISKISTVCSIPFFRVLEVVLILFESAVIILLVRLIREFAPEVRVRTLMIAGLALNPAAILLVCLHCNFDVIVAMWVLLFMLSLLRYNQTGAHTDWLCACLFLGMGILTKTVPLVLAPLLAGGFRSATAPAKFLGGVMLLGPVSLGMSIIFVLSPANVFTYVLAYRSISGYFGFSGLFLLGGISQITRFYNGVFYLLLFAAMLATSVLLWRRQLIGNRETVLLATLLLMGVPALGPGYGPQYLYWFMPFLVATFAFFEGNWRLAVSGFAVIAVCTYVVEYAMVGADGMLLVKVLAARPETVLQAAALMPKVSACESTTGLTLIRLPLFVGYLVLLGVGTLILMRHVKEGTDEGTKRTEVTQEIAES